MTGKLHSAPQCEIDPLRDGANDEGAPIILHPLVVLNVSDHYTRFAAIRLFPRISSRRSSTDVEKGIIPFAEDGKETRVLGILLGTQRGRMVEVCHSFELPARVTHEGRTEIEEAFMVRRIEQYQQIFAKYIVVGWYFIGDKITPEDKRLHAEVFTRLNEAPLLLVMNPTSKLSGSQVKLRAKGGAGPIVEPMKAPSQSAGLLTTYQMELKVMADKPTMTLAPVPHRYASEDSERIAVDHVMRHAVPGGGDGASSTTLHLNNLKRSINMLESRIKVIVAFLEATARGEIELNHSLLRQIGGVCARLPALDCAEFSAAFAEEKHDSMVVAYLSGVTKSICSLNEVVDMFNRFSDRATPVGGSRRRGPFPRQ
ncbi:COP9 signalosome complex subunit 6a [Gracilariopsis chorda]|uniref:COP9 signalosome complex subunit 6 n=1 Tax=Gracilariopsis chorda TaxID=448386 RepID=A0A2V3J1K7_9FLOR|nr:COP9 signalosome complex subunit 6a [Gracilariopsis chorda]|eukprot:PXF48203.1 COP9 signalosome complex subunit 6a [Gracilariopsis chorda]